MLFYAVHYTSIAPNRYNPAVGDNIIGYVNYWKIPGKLFKTHTEKWRNLLRRQVQHSLHTQA